MTNQVKATILRNLKEALVECNNADYEDANDLDPINSRQHNAFGHISNAIRALGGGEELEYFCLNGYFKEMV